MPETCQYVLSLHGDTLSTLPEMVVDRCSVTDDPVTRVIRKRSVSDITRASPQEDDAELGMDIINSVMFMPLPHPSDNTSVDNVLFL